MEYIKRKQNKLGQVRVFTNTNSLKEYSKQNSIQTLLLHEDMEIEEVKHENIKNICILSEGSHLSKKDSFPVIYKYQSAEVIIQELLSYYPISGSLGEIINPIDKKVKIISVYSLGGETYRQKFALALASGYANLKKTLFINLNLYQVLPELLGHSTENGLSDILYYLKQNNPNINFKIKEAIKKYNNLDYIDGVSFALDLNEINAEDMRLCLKELSSEADYETIILDVGYISHAVLDLFQCSQELLLITGEGLWEKAMYEDYHRQLIWAGYEDILEKTKLIPLAKEEKDMFEDFNLEDLNNDDTRKYMARYLKLTNNIKAG